MEAEMVKGRNFPLEIAGVCKLVSQHAIDRYRERLGCAGTDVRVRNRMAKSLRGAVEVKLLPEYEAGEVFRHGKPSRWFRRGELIFAVRDEVVTTMHKGEAERWT